MDLEIWRTERRQLQGNELFSAYGLNGDNPNPVYVELDTVLPNTSNRIVWYHRNERSIWADNLKYQGLGKLVEPANDPLLHRTFGGAIQGDGLIRSNDCSLKTASPRKQIRIAVYPLTAQTNRPEQWLDALDRHVVTVEQPDPTQRRAAHERWWSDFWNRSYIHVTGDDDALTVSRGYALQRFIAACAGRGAQPIKFNGSLFTVDRREYGDRDKEGQIFDADYRRWGGPYWFQNTRLAYWPMVAAGDFDMIQPLFEMYLKALPLAKGRTEIYYKHEGAFYPETIYFWGTYVNTNYGWKREGLPVDVTENRYIRYYWQGGLELSAMMLAYVSASGDRTFLTDKALPLIDAIVTFYDHHYKRDDAGQLRIEPAQALETYWDVVNPLPPIAGLKHVLTTLLKLPEDLTTADQRNRYRRLLAALPPLPQRETKDGIVLAPAATEVPGTNIENPELYAVFPYPLFGVGRDKLEMARWTFAHRRHKNLPGWGQDPIHAACLGMTDVAKGFVIRNFSNHDKRSRFPAFWGPNFDWVPDQDHGSVGMITLQKMVLQEDGQRILVLPTWPKQWNVTFKLRAPNETIVQGDFQQGELHDLKVTPCERRTDIVKMSHQ